MKTLDYLGLARTHSSLDVNDFSSSIAVNIVTNFTDEFLKQLFVGMCLADDIYPIVWTAPYKQYHFLLKDTQGDLYKKDAAITFMLFDLNPYLESEFAVQEHFESTLKDIKNFSKLTKGIVVLGTFLLSQDGRHGLKINGGQLFKQIEQYNKELRDFAEGRDNVYLADTNAIAKDFSFSHTRDLRNLYAFDMPFARELSANISAKWLAYIKARLGRTKKCIVLDLDDTLWGGVVGEVGPLGIRLGVDYPGNAFRSFQQTLLDFHSQGILLAINSKNNPEDVAEVFKNNKNMVLREKHFASVRINWEDKSDNLMSIADELGIGLESMVFLDNDPHNRDLVRVSLPQVLTPDFSLPPEEYVYTLLALSVFDSLSVSKEDTERNSMYAAERERRKAMDTTQDLGEYLRQLRITMRVTRNDETVVPRISQLTLKTNQFNLTTRRYTEPDIKKFFDDGSIVYTAEVEDKYGNYGITNVAVVHFDDVGVATIDSFLMSCRVIGRGIEFALMDHIIAELRKRGVSKIRAHFVATPKNPPAKEFLPTAGFVEVGREGHTTVYELDVETHTGHKAQIPKDAILINTSGYGL